MDALQQIRDHFGKPVYVNSGYRCDRHNKAVGGTSDSYHIKGMAAVIAYQKKNGLTTDGEVGINTWKMLLNV